MRTLPLLLPGVLAACAGKPPEGLGVREGRLAGCPRSPNGVSSPAEDDRHRTAPLAVHADPDEAWARLGEPLAARADARVVGSGPDYLRVEFRTRLGFVDDAEFALERHARVLHVRSASRVGYSDLGKNRGRVEELREALGERPPYPWAGTPWCTPGLESLAALRRPGVGRPGQTAWGQNGRPKAPGSAGRQQRPDGQSDAGLATGSTTRRSQAPSDLGLPEPPHCPAAPDCQNP